MVAQFDSSDDEHDHERFPRNTAPMLSPERVVQIRMDPAVAPDVPSMPVMTRLLADTRGVADTAEVRPPLRQLVTVLRTLGAVSIGWPLDVPPQLAEILTTEEQNQRRAIIEVTFRPDVDLIRAAAVLGDLAVVQEAVPLPQEAPPLQPEPLLGMDDQDLTKQWYVFRVRADRAWGFASGKSVVIGDVDFGFRTTHQDLVNIEAARAFNSHDGSGNVSHGTHISHGTAVLGLAGAARNSLGMLGIAFDASLWPIQANTGAGPRIPGDKWGRGIDYIVSTNSGGRRKVAILEVQTGIGGCWEQTPSTNLAIQQAINHDVVVVVAAGNGDRDVGLTDQNNPYPESGSILAGATSFDPVDNPRSNSSNFGPRITVSAPGHGPADLTCGHLADDGYRPGFGGTSGAAPKIAAACALLLEVDGTLSHSDVKQILIDTGSAVVAPAGKPAGVFLDVEAAVNLAL